MSRFHAILGMTCKLVSLSLDFLDKEGECRIGSSMLSKVIRRCTSLDVLPQPSGWTAHNRQVEICVAFDVHCQLVRLKRLKVLGLDRMKRSWTRHSIAELDRLERSKRLQTRQIEKVWVLFYIFIPG